MKECDLYKKEKGKVRCLACAHKCLIGKEKTGICGVRKNINGKLYLLVYGKVVSMAVDPIEKKPLYHFLPGTNAFSIGTVGCNFRCANCQNWDISQASKQGLIVGEEVSCGEIVKQAIKTKCKSIAYTYNEPTIFIEFVKDTAKIAKKRKLKNILVTNGYMSKEAFEYIKNFVDAMNIDFKSFKDEFYKKYCGGRLKPVLDTIKRAYEAGIHIELTNLLIPGLNDSKKEIKKLVFWVKKNLGEKVPLHFTAFYPCYRLMNLPSTSIETLKKARKIALDAGLKYVYTGNIPDDEGDSSFCPKCGKLLIKRRLFSVMENNLQRGKCKYCKEKIDGVWI